MKVRSLVGTLVAVSLVGGASFALAHPDHDATETTQVQEVKTVVKNPLAAAPDTAALGALAPDFTLTDTDGTEHRLSDYIAAGNVVVLEWFNPDCPFVKKQHETTDNMLQTYQGATKHENVIWLAINSGGEGKQGYGVERNAEARTSYKMAYPVLIDASGTVGRMYGAKTTPHMFVINEQGMLIYNGAIDNAQGGDGKTNYVSDCMNGYFAGDYKPMETKPYGCSVKYAPAS